MKGKDGNTMREKVGQVTMEEKDEIEALFLRKNSLNELYASTSSLDEEKRNVLQEKLVNDLAETNAKFGRWWGSMAKKYQWKGSEKGNWSIDFETGEIFLLD